MYSPYDVMRCKDGWFTIAALSEEGFREFCTEAGMEKLISDVRFKDNAARCENNEELTEEIKPFFMEHTMEDLENIFSRRHFAATSVIDADDLENHPQINERRMLIEVDDPNVGSFKAVGSPFKFEKTVTDIYRPSPLMGRHTRDVLLELGYGRDEIKLLEEKGVVEF